MYVNLLRVSKELEAVEGGFKVGGLSYILNSIGADNVYEITLGNGSIYMTTFFLDAKDEKSAIDRVIHFCINNGYAECYKIQNNSDNVLELECMKNEYAYIRDSDLTSVLLGGISYFLNLISIKLSSSKESKGNLKIS